MKHRKSPNIYLTIITDSEKQELRKRIFQSVHKYKTRKKRIRHSMLLAASIAIIIVFDLYFLRTPKETITDFVKSANTYEFSSSDKVELILNQGDKVSIDGETSTIDYSEDGQKINIGKPEPIDQKTLRNEKVVYNTLLVPYGKRSTIKLADGTVVWLNSGSKLVYPAIFNGRVREVYLEGEAIFEVSHDKDHPFKVFSENHEIEVLGTVFDVCNYLDENSIRTVLKSGSVQIASKDKDSDNWNKILKLSPGDMSTYNKKENIIKTRKVNVDNYFSWRDGILIFKNDNLKYIMAKLSRYYNVDIVINDGDLAKETFSGYLDLKDDIEKVIQTIQETYNFNYRESKDNKIEINK